MLGVLSDSLALPPRPSFFLFPIFVLPRLKNFSFKEQFHFTLDIPKPLLLADVGVRLMQLEFDPFSPQCRTYHSTQLRWGEPG